MADFLMNLSANLIALVALVIAVVTYRATAKIWLRLVEFEGAASKSVYENNREMFHYVSAVIQNNGLHLHDVTVSLCFDTIDDGPCRFGMQRVNYSDTHKPMEGPSDLAQGMAARYMLKSHHFDDFARKIIADVDCVRRRNARLIVCAQGHRVGEIRLWQRFYWLKSWANHFAFRVNQWFDRYHITKDGRKLLVQGRVIPKFNTDSHFRTECFVEAMQRDVSKREAA